ncbi:MucBP domain-containing protein [Lentilactobacillus otakiensis]|uniref:MucBP domain-containing protein n=1 Tax=Lentilactobacillus otakiensis TaxID=481720 RepID=UPI001CBDA85B|nr:MucBP domain-containing protein [Lentilactobacillus otakiensis]
MHSRAGNSSMLKFLTKCKRLQQVATGVVTLAAVVFGLGFMHATADDVTNVVPRTDEFNISKVNPLQYTYVHPGLNQLGAGAWRGAEYAANIPDNAKGTDPQTGQLYLSEWMPDNGFEYFVWQTAFASKYKTAADFFANFTKNDMKTLTSLTSSEDKQNAGTYDNPKASQYYMALMSMQSLEGLQYATGLTSIHLDPNISVSEATFKTGAKNGNLWDIDALKGLNELQSVMIQMFSINDVSALANKPNLTSLSLTYNQIADLSPLATNKGNKGLNLNSGFNHQHILLEPVTLRGSAATAAQTSFTTPSFIIKDLESANLPVKGFDIRAEKTTYPNLYPSTSDGGNIDPVTMTWTNFLPDKTDLYGSLSSHWSDPNSDFEGWIMVPYQFNQTVGNVFVNYQLVQPNGNQLTLAPTNTMAGNVGTGYDIGHDPSTIYTLNKLMGEKGLRSIGVFDGTGLYSDFKANNGKANFVDQAGTYTDLPQYRTVLFASDTSTVTINFEDESGNELKDPLLVPGKTNTDFTLPEIPTTITKDDTVYTLKGLKEGQTVPAKFDFIDTSLTYIYDVKPTAAKPVTVKYVDKDSMPHEIGPSKVLTGKLGDTYDVSGDDYKIDVPGYTFAGISGDATGTFGDTAHTIYMQYTKNPAQPKSVTIKYVDIDNMPHAIGPEKVITGKIGDNYNTTETQYRLKIDGYTFVDIQGNATGQISEQGQTVYYRYKRDAAKNEAQPIKIRYVDADNMPHEIAPTRTVAGLVGDKYDVSDNMYKLSINGYTFKDIQGDMTGTFDATGHTIYYRYTKDKTTPVTPPVNLPVTPVTPVNPTPTPKPDSTPTPQPKTEPTPEQPVVAPSEGGSIAKKGEAVYSLKKIYLYKNANFKKGERIASYAKKPRVNRPMFVVSDYAKSKNGALRYVVKDVNHHAKSDGMKGYITAQYAYVRPVYYHSKHQTLTVINPTGVNEYTKANLTGKIKNFKQGTQLKVKGFIKHNLTTRYLLSNGHYITGNRKLVFAGKLTQPTKIKVKHSIYLYNNANFSKRIKQIKKGTVLKVKKWDYSHQYSTTTFGAKRYLVSGGYVTANAHFVKIVK